MVSVTCVQGFFLGRGSTEATAGLYRKYMYPKNKVMRVLALSTSRSLYKLICHNGMPASKLYEMRSERAVTSSIYEQ